MRYAFRRLGHITYSSYLSSKQWRTVRAQVLARDNKQCQLCLCRGEVVHHIDYKLKTLTGRKMTSLITLCRDCHESIEHDIDGTKIDNLSSKQRILDTLLIKMRGINLSQWKRGVTRPDHKPCKNPRLEKRTEPVLTRRERAIARSSRSKMLTFKRPSMPETSGLSALVASRRYRDT